MTSVRSSKNAAELQYKLPDFTFPDLASLLKVTTMPSQTGFAGRNQRTALRKVNVNLGSLEVPTVDQVKLNMSAADITTLRSLPLLAEAMLTGLIGQIQGKAAIMGIELVNASEAELNVINTKTGGSTTGRRLSASNATDSIGQKDNIVKIMSRTGSLFSDGFSVLRATMTSISQAAILFGGMLPGIMTGTVTVDAVHLFTFCTNVSNLGAELAHLVGRVLSATSDALASSY